MPMRRSTGPHGGRCKKRGCGFRLDIRTDGAGHAFAACSGCRRTARGLCLDCPATIPPGAPCNGSKPLRCSTCRPKHAKAVRLQLERVKYADNPTPKRRQCRKYRSKNRKRLAAAAKAARDAERAKGPPTPIDRLYWREKTRRNRANRSPELHAHELERRRQKRAAAKNPQRLEVAA